MAVPIILGADLSWTGFALCAGSSVDGKDFAISEERRISSKPDEFATHYHRLDYMGERFMEFLDWVFPEFVAIEGYAFGAKQGREQAGELGGHIRWLLMKADVSFIIVPPTVVKKFVTGKGNSPKEQMMQQVYKRWGYEAANNDACDAYSLMRFGWWYHSRETKTKSMQTLLEKCEVVGA